MQKEQKPTTTQVEGNGIDQRYMYEWEKFKLKGVLYRSTEINGETVDQLVLPAALKDVIFTSYHDDLGHQGRDRTISLIRHRFFWPGMKKCIKEKVQQCDMCIRRNTAPVKVTELINITSTDIWSWSVLTIFHLKD